MAKLHRLSEQKLLLLNSLSVHFYNVAASKGFHDPDQDAMGMPKYIANLHGEISELWEAFRAGKLDRPCNKAKKMKAAGLPVLTCAEEEIADILIRVLDVARVYGIDVAHAVAVKDAFNQTRPLRHGGKKA